MCQHYHTGPIATHVAHTDTPGCLPGPAGCRVIPGCPRGHKGHAEAPVHPWSSTWHPDTPGCPPGHWDTFRCPPISMQVPTRTHRTHGHPCVPIRPFLTSLFPPHPPVTCLHPSVDAPEPRDAAVARHGLQRHPDHPQCAARGRRRLRLHRLQHAGHGRGHGHALRPGCVPKPEGHRVLCTPKLAGVEPRGPRVLFLCWRG